MMPLVEDRSQALRLAVEGSPDAVCLYLVVPGEPASKLRLVYANKAVERLTGLTPPAAIAGGLELLDGPATAATLSSGWGVSTTRITLPGGIARDVEVTSWADAPGARNRYLTCIARDTTSQRELEESLLDLSAALESSADMILIVERKSDDEPWRIVYANAAFLRETGYSMDETKGLAIEVLVARAEPGLVDRVRWQASLGGDSQMDVQLSRKDGTWFWSAWRGRSIAHAHALPLRRVVTIRNIHERVVSEWRLTAYSEQLRRLHVVAASSGRSAESQIEAILKFGTEAYGMESAFAGAVIDDLFTWEHLIAGSETLPAAQLKLGMRIPLDEMPLRAAIRKQDVVAFEDLRPDGSTPPPAEHDPGWRSYLAAPLVVRGELYGGIGFASLKPRRHAFETDELDLMRLIAALLGSATERGMQERRLDALAFTDPLTGLPNRVLLDDRLQQLISRAKRSGQRFAVHALDLDFFKQINDQGGHAAGDEALRLISNRFVSVLRESDTLARTGGDEFVVLQPAAESDADAERLAQRLIEALDEPLSVEGKRYDVGVSIGIAIFDRDGSEAESLLRRADRALYVAKAAGRNRLSFSKATD